MAATLTLLSGCQHAQPPAPPSPAPLVTGAYPAYGRAADLSWFAGRIDKTLDGCVYLVFGSARRSPWGGRIAVIAKPDTTAQLPDGDMVVAFGKLAATPRGECGSAAFEASRIQEH